MKKKGMGRLIVMAPARRTIIDAEAERLADRIELAVLDYLAVRAEERRTKPIVH